MLDTLMPSEFNRHDVNASAQLYVNNDGACLRVDMASTHSTMPTKCHRNYPRRESGCVQRIGVVVCSIEYRCARRGNTDGSRALNNIKMTAAHANEPHSPCD